MPQRSRDGSSRHPPNSDEAAKSKPRKEQSTLRDGSGIVVADVPPANVDPKGFVIGILRQSGKAEEKAAAIMKDLPHLKSDKVLSWTKMAAAGDKEEIPVAAENILRNVVTNNLLFLFEHYLIPTLRANPFVHDGETAGGVSAVERLGKPFGQKHLVNIQSEVNLPLAMPKVLVLHGESGIGKTHLALASNPDGLVVYLLFDNDFTLPHESRIKLGHEGVFPKIDDVDAQRFVDTVVEKCSVAFQRGKPKGRTDEWIAAEMAKLHVRLVVDELGEKPNLIRLFISNQDAIRKALRNGDAHHHWPGCRSIDIVLVGTGINLTVSLGSSPEAYATQQVASADRDFFVELIKSRWWMPSPHPIDALDLSVAELACLKDLVENRRAAVLAAMYVAHIMAGQNVCDGDDAMRVLCEAVSGIVYHVALKYKGLNGLQRLTPNELRVAALEAIALAMPQQKRRKPTVKELPKYVAKLGLLADVSKPGGGAHGSTPDLHMSAAVRVMLLVMLGFTDMVTRRAKGEGLERLVALKCVIALLATRDPSALHQMLHTAPLLGSGSTWISGDACQSTPSADTLTKTKNGVAYMKLSHWLADVGEMEKVSATLGDVRAHVSGGGAVVIVNGANAPYADVIAVRNGYLGLFQAKDAKVFKAQVEADKLVTKGCSVTNALLEIAGVNAADVGLVIVSRETEKAVEHTTADRTVPWYAVSTDSDFLFPFRWTVKDDSFADANGRHTLRAFEPPH